MIRFYHTTDAYGFLSNYWPVQFELDGKQWPSVEHYFQAQKHSGDAVLCETIRLAPTPDEAKRMAWAGPVLRPDWDTVRDEVMRRALHAKFTQNESLRGALLATGQTPLVEHSQHDAYWADAGDGSGRNQLGALLGALRAELAADAAPSVNRIILNWFFAKDVIRLRDAPFLHQSPTAQTVPWDRVEGMLLGLAIGDALGNTTESQRPVVRGRSHGEIRDYLPNRYADWRAVGLPSDDSQMAFLTFQQLLNDNTLIPQALAESFATHQIFGIGKSVREFLDAFVNQGQPWYLAAQPSAGNGALMRIAPVVVPYVNAPTPELWSDLALAAMVTHNDTASISSCVALGGMLWDLLGMTAPPASAWWHKRFVELVQQIEQPTLYAPRSGNLPQEEHLFSAWIDSLLGDPALPAQSTLEACERWYSGAYLLETVPSALLILQRYAHDPEQAIERAVNDTVDNDTVAAIVGAAVGALHGKDALPQRWRTGLLGRLGADDDGALFALIDRAKERWG